jgi:hypothetical protein
MAKPGNIPRHWLVNKLSPPCTNFGLVTGSCNQLQTTSSIGFRFQGSHLGQAGKRDGQSLTTAIQNGG